MMAAIVIFLVLGLSLVAAAKDVMGYTIPNWIALALIGLFPVGIFALGMTLPDIMNAVLAGGLMLVIGFALFAPGWIGGGDAKLMAALALWVGWSDLIAFVSFSALWGGVLAIGLLIMRRQLAHIPYIATHAPRCVVEEGAPAPYGVAIAAGMLSVLPNSHLLTALLG
ncbi:A24 family peptidase [Woodsholea maritima]|uniref:A24 family peptidase n=1 Tax=Woodsholea maritima TaxID=240237 RepID=UPI0003745A1E|nr:prepilin peptidase [Woodsholea maritima]